MARSPRRLSRIAMLACFTFVLFFFTASRCGGFGDTASFFLGASISSSTSKLGKSATNRLSLSDEQCRAQFPGLFDEIDDMVARGPFEFERSVPDYMGLVQGRIVDGTLRILTTSPPSTPELVFQRTAVLSQLYRALLTSPSALPDTYFAFTVNDVPKNNTWAFARPNKKSSYNVWLMPNFSFWSWPKSNLGTMSDVLRRIERIEGEVPWEQKIDQAVWRGTVWFNPVGQPSLRQDLVAAAKGREWADVEVLDGGDGKNALKIEDFCRYKYVIYTEGVTYSGRLPYHQACGSVLLTAPLSWLTSTARLMRPITSQHLLADIRGGEDAHQLKAQNGGRTVAPSGSVPPVTSYREANAIYVKQDFSDLENVISILQSHPEVARRIAENQRRTMAQSGYLSHTAETCYWRALIRGWASTAKTEAQGWGDEQGEMFETWLLGEVNRKENGMRSQSPVGGRPG